MTPNIDTIFLSAGSHNSRDAGTCFMEAAAWIAGVAHSDEPTCVCPILGIFLRNWNDALPDEDRQLLKPYLRLVIGTGRDGFSSRRSWMALDWLIREQAATWMDLTPSLQIHARALRALPEISDSTSLAIANEVVKAARAAAWAAAGAAAWAAAGDAAGAAVYETAKRLQMSAFDLLDRMLLLGLDNRVMPDVSIRNEPQLSSAKLALTETP